MALSFVQEVNVTHSTFSLFVLFSKTIRKEGKKKKILLRFDVFFSPFFLRLKLMGDVSIVWSVVRQADAQIDAAVCVESSHGRPICWKGSARVTP